MTRCIRVTTFLAICLIFSNWSQAQGKSFEVLTPEVKQGGTLVLKIDNSFLGGLPAVEVFDKVYWPNEDGLVFVGIDAVNVKPGKYMVSLFSLFVSPYQNEFIVLDGNFIERPWPFGPRSATVDETKNRKKEREIIEEALNSEPNGLDRHIDSKFATPLERIEVVEDFGVKRMSRGVVVERHGGVDLKTNDPHNLHDQKPKPVTSINSGKVVLAKRFSLEGNMVIICHGQGVYSLYLHLSQFKIKMNQEVQRGQVIGLSGRTGIMVTGPHLDFRVKIKGTNVNPLDFIETANKYLG